MSKPQPQQVLQSGQIKKPTPIQQLSGYCKELEEQVTQAQFEESISPINTDISIEEVTFVSRSSLPAQR
ncbi:MAG: hypothetical protein HQL69_04450 [Magnetococcales bacterium]|nr:hypothetical protein [Magnetococcales bacterium]